MRHILRVIERLTEGIGSLAALVIIPLVLATCYEVFARYVFGAPTIWAFELGYTLMKHRVSIEELSSLIVEDSDSARDLMENANRRILRQATRG